MKQLLILACILSLYTSSFAQKEDEEKTHKFRKDNIFLGGAIGLGFGGGGFSGGANPEIGYSVAQWLDAGISTNFNYVTIAPEYNGGRRDKSFNYGAGVFARVYPIRSIFLQVLPEYNWTKLSASYNGGPTEKVTYEAPSLLLGIGYSSREIGSTSFYTAIMFDAGNNVNSPYIGYLGTKYPIIRTGFNFYLRPSRK